jgi:hypothetical protein
MGTTHYITRGHVAVDLRGDVALQSRWDWAILHSNSCPPKLTSIEKEEEEEESSFNLFDKNYGYGYFQKKFCTVLCLFVSFRHPKLHREEVRSPCKRKPASMADKDEVLRAVSVSKLFVIFL